MSEPADNHDLTGHRGISHLVLPCLGALSVLALIVWLVPYLMLFVEEMFVRPGSHTAAPPPEQASVKSVEQQSSVSGDVKRDCSGEHVAGLLIRLDCDGQIVHAVLGDVDAEQFERPQEDPIGSAIKSLMRSGSLRKMKCALLTSHIDSIGLASTYCSVDGRDLAESLREAALVTRHDATGRASQKSTVGPGPSQWDLEKARAASISSKQSWLATLAGFIAASLAFFEQKATSRLLEKQRKREIIDKLSDAISSLRCFDDDQRWEDTARIKAGKDQLNSLQSGLEQVLKSTSTYKKNEADYDAARIVLKDWSRGIEALDALTLSANVKSLIDCFESIKTDLLKVGD